MSQKTTSEWIEQARKKHGDKYDYSNSIYVDWKTKIKIICPKHGEFWQDPSSHLRGCNCPKCTNSPAGLILEERKQNFIKKANLLYGNIYDYSKINYQGKRKKVCIICPEHGEFWQTPERHLQNGCPKCSRIVNKSKLHDKNLLDFISKSKKIFNNKYDYSKVKYVNSNIKVRITCPEHGDFYQTPLSHLKGYECPKCMKIKNKKKILTNRKNCIILYKKVEAHRIISMQSFQRLPRRRSQKGSVAEDGTRQSTDLAGGIKSPTVVAAMRRAIHNKTHPCYGSLCLFWW